MVGIKKPFGQPSSANAATGAKKYGGFPKPKSDSSKRVQSDSSAAPTFGANKVKAPIPRAKPSSFAFGGPKTAVTKPKIPKAPASPFGSDIGTRGQLAASKRFKGLRNKATGY